MKNIGKQIFANVMQLNTINVQFILFVLHETKVIGVHIYFFKTKTNPELLYFLTKRNTKLESYLKRLDF